METEAQYIKTETVPIAFKYNGRKYSGFAMPLETSCREGACFELDVTLNGQDLGTIACGGELKWKIRNFGNQGLVDKIGEAILLWYE